MTTAITPPAEVREIAVDWLLNLIDTDMSEDLGEVATPLDHLAPRDEREAVLWLREQVAALTERPYHHD